MSVEAATGEAAEGVIRVPANLMGLLRQSYDSREKVLDWMLAIGVVAAMAYIFRDELRSCFADPNDPEPGARDQASPNMDVAGSLSTNTSGRPGLYSYNMPVARNIRAGIGPTTSPAPYNPSLPPRFPGA